MNESEITSKLQQGYSLLLKEGRSQAYLNIHNDIVTYSGHTEQTKVKLCTHFLALQDILFFKQMASQLPSMTIANILAQYKGNPNEEFREKLMGWVHQTLPGTLTEKLIINYHNAGLNHFAIELVKLIKQFSNYATETLFTFASSALNAAEASLAREILQTILARSPSNEFALYNLAILHEDLGQFEESKALHHKNFTLNQSVYSYSRLLNTESKDKLIELLSEVEPVQSKQLTKAEEIDLNFSLGFAYDRIGNYEAAIGRFNKANELARVNAKPIDLQLLQEKQGKLNFKLDNSESPIFICGMHRSGSTLLEQVIASHSAFQNGGEIPFFSEKVLDYCLQGADKAKEIATLYKNKFPDLHRVSNKLPDNFIYIGLIKALFPKAKFIITQRNKEDNCISLYFQNMSEQYNYSTCLNEIQSFYDTHQQIVSEWKLQFHDDVYLFKYEDFIDNPQHELKMLCEFLNVDFEAEMLEFYKLKNNVRTASFHQVRTKLNKNSINRFENYKQFIKW